jgi:hypothetical protein
MQWTDKASRRIRLGAGVIERDTIRLAHHVYSLNIELGAP